MEIWSSRHFIVKRKSRLGYHQHHSSSPNSTGLQPSWRPVVCDPRHCRAHVNTSKKSGYGLRKSVPQVAILLGQVAGVVRMFYTIGVGEFLHPLRIIIISAITATPSCLEAKRVSRGEDPGSANAYQECNRHRKPHQANQSDASEKWLGRETQWIRCRKEES